MSCVLFCRMRHQSIGARHSCRRTRTTLGLIMSRSRGIDFNYLRRQTTFTTLGVSFLASRYLIRNLPFCLTSGRTTTTMTKAALLTLGGTHYLLSLASKVVQSLHSHYDQQLQTAGNEDSEAEIAENLYDVELTLKELDPVCWKELVDKRLESTGEVVKS